MLAETRGWLSARTSVHTDWTVADLLTAKERAGSTVSVVIPAKNEAATVGAVVAGIVAEQLLAAVRDHHPDVAIVDIRMPPTHTTEGLDAARVIREEAPGIGIVVLSAHVDVEHAMELLAGGHTVTLIDKRPSVFSADPVEDVFVADRDADFVEYVAARVAERRAAEDAFFAGADPRTGELR